MKKIGWKFLFCGVIISGVMLYLALRDMDWTAFRVTIRSMQVLPLLICALLMVSGIILRGYRWSLVAGQSLPQMSKFVRATNLGVLGNQLLPGRLGEIVRVYSLVRMLPTGLSESLGSAMIDRVTDVIVLFLAAWFVSMVATEDIVPQSWLIGLMLLLAIFLIGSMIVRTQWFDFWLSGWSSLFLRRWKLRPESFLLKFNGLTRRLFQIRAGGSVLAVAALVFMADYLTVAAALWSAGLELPAIAPLLLWVMLAVGSALPSSPGYVGVYQLAAVWSLGAYGVPSHQAVAVSIVLQVLTFSISLIVSSHELRHICSTSNSEID